MSFNKPSMNGLDHFSIEEVNESIDINAVNIATNTSNIATNTSAIATNTSDIATNTSAIATNTSNISTNTSVIATNTSNIATNTSAIATNTSNIATNTSAIATNTSDIATNTSAIATNTSNISTNTSAIATNTSNIATNTSDIATNTSAIATNTSNIATNTSDIATNTGNITSLQNDKQDTLTAGTNVSISAGNVISSTDTNTEYTAGTNVSISAGNVISSTDTNTEYTAGTNVSISAGNVISSTDTDTTYTAGNNITINGSNEISSTDTNTEYTPLTNGGLVVNGSNEFSIDLTNTNSTFEIPQSVRIEKDGTPQLLVEPAHTNSNDAEIEIRGARNGSTSSGQAKLVFANYDDDLNSTNHLGRIDGRVSNATSNIGGLVFSSFADGNTRTGALSLSAAGNFNMGSGDTFQDDYKLKVNGDVNLNGSNYIKPQIQFLTYDKDNLNGSNWGNGSIQNTVLANRIVGDSFCSIGTGTASQPPGVVTFTKNGYYRIRVSAQLQVKVYTDRLGFMNYLRIISGGTTTNYDFSEYKNFFGWTYTRNNGDGAHGSVSFEDYIYLTSGSVLSVRHKLETGGTISYTNTLPASNIDNYLSLQIERVYDTNPE